MLVQVKPHIAGSLRLQPVKVEDRKLISESNQYNRDSVAYLTDSQDVKNFVSTLSFEDKAKIDNGYSVQVEIDNGEFRHMIGGQSD